jgi:hypothetical protein
MCTAAQHFKQRETGILTQGAQRLKHEADYLSRSSVEVKNRNALTLSTNFKETGFDSWQG